MADVWMRSRLDLRYGCTAATDKVLNSDNQALDSDIAVLMLKFRVLLSEFAAFCLKFRVLILKDGVLMLEFRVLLSEFAAFCLKFRVLSWKDGVLNSNDEVLRLNGEQLKLDCGVE